MQNLDLQGIVKALQTVLPKDGNPVALHEPFFSGNEWAYVKECLDTGWVSSAGKFVGKFEKMLVDFTGVKHAVTVVNGTAALHVCLKLLDVNPGDEILVPALTFVATANAVVYCDAIPHFVDSEEKTLGLAPEKLSDYLHDIAEIRADGCFNRSSGRRIKAVIPMHTFGHPVDLDPLIEICNRYKLELIEDAAESIGSMRFSVPAAVSGTDQAAGLSSRYGPFDAYSSIKSQTHSSAGISQHPRSFTKKLLVLSTGMEYYCQILRDR